MVTRLAAPTHRPALTLAVLALAISVSCREQQSETPDAAGVATPATPVGNVVPEDAAQAAERIIAAARGNPIVMDRLAWLCDGIGARPAGSEGLEQAIDWSFRTMKADGLDSVSLQPVQVSVWERGDESALLLSPGPPRSLAILGLGRSVGTPEGGITAPAVVVRDFDELERLGGQVGGKIVVFNFPMKQRDDMFPSYGEAVEYRWRGAAEASKHGAVAALVRSATTRSLRTPHTGAMKPYEDGERPIPAAGLSTEDSEMLQRLQDRGERLTVRLVMGARTLSDRQSANAIGELRGRESPEQVVVIGAHIDSWDVSSGAHDDGTGVVMTIEALRLLKDLDLRPRRTVRGVLFTNEERGLEGGKAYRDRYRDELDLHVAALESDSGGFAPRGFSFSGADEAAGLLEALMPLFEPLGATMLRRGGSGADIGPIVRLGVPGMGLVVDSSHYFDYHHTKADTFDKVVPEELKESLAAFTLMTWLLAEMPEPLPRMEAPAGN
jgi:carboxypeptidase Q